jgi:hypothetical protein
MPLGKWFIPGLFAVFAVAALALIAATFAGGDNAPPAAFTVLWLGALTWNAYWWLFRIATELRIDGLELVWSSPFRSGRVSFGQLTEIRPMRLASNVEIFKVDNGQTIIVMAAKGLREFTDEISRRRPDLSVRLGWQARIAERMPGWSRFKRQ